jgi:hypothetical protein
MKDESEQPDPPRYKLCIEHIPDDLKQSPHWMVWRWGERRASGKWAKVPHSVATNKPADALNDANWCAFERACLAMGVSGYSGIGYVPTADDGFTLADLDCCRDVETGELAEWASAFVERFHTYSEISPSGTGLRLVLRAKKPGLRCDFPGGEVYDARHFVTITGNHLPGTPTAIEPRQVELDAWYAETFSEGASAEVPVGEPSDLTDDDVLELARQSQSGEVFMRLMAGDTTGFRSRSEADMRLVGLLSFFTQDAEQIERLCWHSELAYEKWDRADYLKRTIQRAFEGATTRYTRQPRQPLTREAQHYAWQERTETAWERGKYLFRVSQSVKERVRQHINVKETSVLAVKVFPGGGKSTGTAELGLEVDLAWIAERHKMVENVAALRQYRHIRPCTRQNCPQHELHHLLASLGFNTWELHKKHACEYGKQHQARGSAVYQLDHVPTAYPKRHEAIIIDETPLQNWLKERTIGQDVLQKLLVWPGLFSSPDLDYYALCLLKAVRDVLTGAERTNTLLRDKRLFEALNAACHGKLAEFVAKLSSDGYLMNQRPGVRFDLDKADAFQQASQLPPVVFPHLLAALVAEIPNWRSGKLEWNGCLRVCGPREWALRIIEPRRFTVGEGEMLPPITVLDATADDELLSRLLDIPVQVVREDDVVPPPHMRHIAVRTGRRYSKSSLVGWAKSKKQELQSVINEARYLLNELDPDSTLRQDGKVGLISYRECVGQLGAALDVPENRQAYFYALRGENRLEDCAVLFVIGTPTPPIDAMEWWARALYRNDDLPIDPTADKVDGVWRYRDARMQRVAEHLSQSELSQAAHRNRPLRADRRTVVTLCQGEVEYLPATEVITSFPQLTDTGEMVPPRSQADAETLRSAWERIVARGEKPSVRRLKQEAEVGTDRVVAWLREVRADNDVLETAA